MLLAFNTAQLGRLLLQILSKTHLSLERKITVIKTLYLQNAVIFYMGRHIHTWKCKYTWPFKYTFTKTMENTQNSNFI